MSEPARADAPTVDVRIGSTANALQPVSSAERSFAAGRAQWIVLLLVASAAVVADQLTKQVVGRTLELGESVDHDPDLALRGELDIDDDGVRRFLERFEL